MSPVKLGKHKIKLPAFLAMAVVMGLLFSGCAHVPRSPLPSKADEPTPAQAPTQDRTSTPPREAELSGGALAARQVLAQQLHVDISAVDVIRVERTEWPDACLGLERPGVVCAQVITPGYRVTLEAQGQRYEYHTDLDGGQVVLTAAPETDTTGAAIDWMRIQGDRCERAVIGPETVVFGACGASLISGRYASEERQADYGYFVRTFEYFESETPAGRVVFQGRGIQQAAPSQQRMITEWARLVAMEASAGRSGASWGLALAWHREGGIAGFCDDLTVYVSGDAYAASCKGDSARTLAHVRLEPSDLKQLYLWVDRLGNWEWRQTDDAKADAMTITLVFSGQGEAAPSDTDKEEAQAWAAQLFAKMSAP